MDLYFLKYNNYYNRQLKRAKTMEEYSNYILGVTSNANFNPNDGIYTTVVVNMFYWNTEDMPDYMLAVENGQIVSRWFVIESKRNMAKQYEIQLFRDTLADYFDSLQSAVIFVEKGMLGIDNPLLFNRENMTVNQIRQTPTLLSDATKIPWIVGYIPHNTDFGSEPIEADYNPALNADISIEDIGDWEYAQYVDFSKAPLLPDTYFTVFKYTHAETDRPFPDTIYNEVLKVDSLDGDIYYNDDDWYIGYLDDNNGNNRTDEFKNTLLFRYKQEQDDLWGDMSVSETFRPYRQYIRTDSTYRTYVDGYVENKYNVITDDIVSDLEDLEGKIIYDGASGKHYRIGLKIEPLTASYSIKNETTMVNALKNQLPAIAGGTVTNNTFGIEVVGYTYQLTLETTQVEIQVTLSDDRSHLYDEPYDMFCIPYGNFKIKHDGIIFQSQKIGTKLASAIAEKAGTGAVYDVQILPYCPIMPYINKEYRYVEGEKVKHSLITDANGKNISAVFWCTNSNFNFTINHKIPKMPTALSTKVASHCRKYRLVSPNYASMFEFDPYKNGGVDYFRVDCSYKPFNPYIRIAPVFKELYGYGGDYDSRGLILSGDFSITQLSNAWANYQLQNKNFEAMFARDMQHMDIQHKYQGTTDWFNAFLGGGQAAVGGAAIGAMAGASSGTPVGAIIGGAVGATGGLATGFIDIVRNKRQRTENKQYEIDKYNFNMGNIQAIPTALSKTTALTINNPIIPMLEVYTCTYKEEEAFTEMIKYQGMTVMAIGNIGQYSEGYFKGQLIRIERLGDDYHLAETIANELDKGVYLT